MSDHESRTSEPASSSPAQRNSPRPSTEHTFALPDGTELFYRAWLPEGPTDKALLVPLLRTVRRAIPGERRRRHNLHRPGVPPGGPQATLLQPYSKYKPLSGPKNGVHFSLGRKKRARPGDPSMRPAPQLAKPRRSLHAPAPGVAFRGPPAFPVPCPRQPLCASRKAELTISSSPRRVSPWPLRSWPG
jgi:hypothetical protein